MSFSSDEQERKQKHKKRKKESKHKLKHKKKKDAKKDKKKKDKRKGIKKDRKPEPAPVVPTLSIPLPPHPPLPSPPPRPASLAIHPASLPPTKRAAMAPMSFAAYRAQQAVVREVFDEETGRMRLVRGTGEIIERIVSKEQQRAINKRATEGDGLSFQVMMRKGGGK